MSHRAFVFAALIVAIGLAPGCTPASTQTTGRTPATGTDQTSMPDPVDPALAAQYQQALDTAKNPTPERVYRELTAITPDNPELTWQSFDGVPHVLAASWVSTFKYFEGSVGGTYNTGNYDMWVTAAPFVQDLCADPAWRGADLDLRLEQLLGLPPQGQHVGFVEVWVKPADLFRPCPDNEITDRACGLALLDDTEPWYREWFNDLRAKQYFVSRDPESPGWPWTQLGYTFDWHDLDDPVGPSEFVIRRNATVRIQALVPTSEYCKVQ